MKIVIYKLNILGVNVTTIPKQIQKPLFPPPPIALETIKIMPVFPHALWGGGVVIGVFVGSGFFCTLSFVIVL